MESKIWGHQCTSDHWIREHGCVHLEDWGSEKKVKDRAPDTTMSKGEQEDQEGDGEENQGEGGSGESWATEFNRKREEWAGGSDGEWICIFPA